MIDDLYSGRLMELAADIPRLGRLPSPDGSATAHSRLCGSTITVDVVLGDDGRVADFAHDVRACALGKASASLMARFAVGMDIAELRDIRTRMRAMLMGGGPAPDGKWSDLAVLEPVRAFKARHASTLLTFDAVVEAVAKAQAHRAAA